MSWPPYEDYSYWKEEQNLHLERRNDFDDYPQDNIGMTPCDGECKECIKRDCWEE